MTINTQLAPSKAFIHPDGARTIDLSPTGRVGFPNGASTDVARVLRAHGYRFDALALLDALRAIVGGAR